MTKYKLELIEFLLYRVLHDDVEIGTIKMGENPTVPKFTYKNPFVSGTCSEIGEAVRTLRKSYMENVQ